MAAENKGNERGRLIPKINADEETLRIMGKRFNSAVIVEVLQQLKEAKDFEPLKGMEHFGNLSGGATARIQHKFINVFEYMYKMEDLIIAQAEETRQLKSMMKQLEERVYGLESRIKLLNSNRNSNGFKLNSNNNSNNNNSGKKLDYILAQKNRKDRAMNNITKKRYELKSKRKTHNP